MTALFSIAFFGGGGGGGRLTPKQLGSSPHSPSISRPPPPMERTMMALLVNRPMVGA